MTCYLVGSFILLAMIDGPISILLPPTEPVHVYNESMMGSNWAVVEVVGEKAFRLPGIPAEAVTKALSECKSR